MTNLLVLLYMQFDSVVPSLVQAPSFVFCIPYLALAFSAFKRKRVKEVARAQ